MYLLENSYILENLIFDYGLPFLMSKKLFGVEFGGSKLEFSEVDPKTGLVVGEVQIHDISQVDSNETLFNIINSYITQPGYIGIGAAGVVNEDTLIIENSPNSAIKENITFAKTLQEKGHSVVLTNDMRAEVQGAARFGAGKEYGSVLLATYSSGFNCAVVENGVNTTSAEFGHIMYEQNNGWFCGCGGQGHFEPYVSGNGAASIAKQFFDITKIKEHTILEFALNDFNLKAKKTGSDEFTMDDLSKPNVHAQIISSIGSKHVYQAFGVNPQEAPQKNIQEAQVKGIAASLGAMKSAYGSVEIMVLKGSQTKDWGILFEPAINLYNKGGLQHPGLKNPPIVLETLPHIGIVGSAAYLMSKMDVE